MTHPTRTFRWLPVATMGTGMDLRIPLHEIRGGAGDGPTLGISAGIHGDERTGVQALCRFVRELDPSRMKGRLLVVPVANPLAWGAVRPETPVDAQNLNRVFPGESEGFFAGFVTHQMAHVLVREVLDHLDAYVDLHSSGLYGTIDWAFVFNSKPLARAFGTPALVRSPEPTGYPGGAYWYVAAKRGKPVTLVEAGGGPVDQAPYVRRVVDGLRNALAVLGMIDDDPPPAPQQILFNDLRVLRPRAAGILHPEVPTIHEEVAGGTVLGRTISPFTLEEVEVFHAPFERSVPVHTRLASWHVEPGDYAYVIGDLSTAETWPPETAERARV